jgi:phosphatidylserine/phosphatidylglycerophosphate/cardiolipin synthase-like enzyme
MGNGIGRLLKNPLLRDFILLFLGFMLGIVAHSLFSALFFPPVVLPVFSPYAENDIISMINNAEDSIDIEMYVLTSDDVVKALKNARDRGVVVRVILEKRVIGADNNEAFEALSSHGIEVRWASETFKLTHSKFMLVDGRRVLVGSHNFSKSALTMNREASVIIENDPAVIGSFKKIFEEDWALAG